LRARSGLTVDKAIALDDMQRGAKGRAERIDRRQRRDLDPFCVDAL
jgi:hypothetical protein